MATSLARESQHIIQQLEKKPFRAICPCCEEDILLRDAGLFYLDKFKPLAKDLYQDKIKEIGERAKELRDKEAKMQQSSKTLSQAVNVGLTLEQIAPSLQGFPYQCNDCRSLFKPIDYVVFKDLCQRGEVTEIMFAEVKTGGAKLNPKEEEIKSLVEKERVSWDTYDLKVSK